MWFIFVHMTESNRPTGAKAANLSEREKIESVRKFAMKWKEKVSVFNELFYLQFYIYIYI